MYFSLVSKLALSRPFSSNSITRSKVAVLGAAGGIGQPLSLLLKSNPRVSEINIYDVKGAPGVAADLAHINTKSTIVGYEKDGLEDALQNADMVIIPAGVPRKPGMTRDDLFNVNASIGRDLASATAKICPKAMLCIICNPVNSIVPIASKVYEDMGVYDRRRIFGVTELDLVRASKFVSELKGCDPQELEVPVVGGHAAETIVPLLSQAGCDLEGEDRDKLIKRIQFGGDEVVKAKDGAGSATLSMAHAGASFADKILRAIQGETGVYAYSYVRNPHMQDQGLEFFSSRVDLGQEGIQEIHDIGKINDYEEKLISACIPLLRKNIEKGLQFAEKAHV